MKDQSKKFTKINKHETLMQALARYIETHSEQTLTLEQLASEVHLSPSYLQRYFKAIIGISPKEYQESCRLQKLKIGLQQQQNVSSALYDVGFGSPSRLYERLDNRLGMTPSQYRAGGKDMNISYAHAATKLGLIMMAATDRGICFIQFGESKQQLLEQLKHEYPHASTEKMTACYAEQFTLWMEALNAYLQGKEPLFDLPLDIRGTAFQLKVWKYLQTIPSGKTISYRELAQGIGNPNAIRAVASACAKNTIAIVIPCHRVIRGNGDLAGYRWGLERKQHLIDLEKAIVHTDK